MTRCHRQHRLWRSLTRTRCLVAALPVVVVAKTHGAPPHRIEVVAWVGSVLLLPAGASVIPRVTRLREDLEMRRERCHP